MLDVLQEFDYAKVRDGEVFPDCAHELTVIDVDTGKELDRIAVEVNAKSGWADVFTNEECPKNWRETERIHGNFRIVLCK